MKNRKKFLINTLKDIVSELEAGNNKNIKLEYVQKSYTREWAEANFPNLKFDVTATEHIIHIEWIEKA